MLGSDDVDGVSLSDALAVRMLCNVIHELDADRNKVGEAIDCLPNRKACSVVIYPGPLTFKRSVQAMGVSSQGIPVARSSDSQTSKKLRTTLYGAVTMKTAGPEYRSGFSVANDGPG